MPMTARATSTQAHIERGFALQSQGDLPGAQAAYEAALHQDPEHPAALQLLGLLARKRGEPALAQNLMRRSLLYKPDQPHVWNNLGNLLLAQGQADEALACFDEALQQQGEYADAHYNRARALHALAQRAEALLAAERAHQSGLTQQGRVHASALQLKSQIQSELGDLAAALQTVDSALAAAPNKPALLHNRGNLLQRLNRFREALDMHLLAQAQGLDVADAHYNLGNTLQSLGRQDEAVAAYRQALQRQADHPLALLDLARLRWRMGHGDFDAELRLASDAQPASAQAAAVRAHLLWRAERYAVAAEAYDLARQREPQAAQHHDGWARCQARLRRFDLSLPAHALAQQLSPNAPELMRNHAVSLLMAGQPEQALLQTHAALLIDANDPYAWALQGLAWRMLGDPKERWLNDFDRLIQVVDLPAPAGFGSMAEFNQALAAELVALHQDQAAPVDQTLRGGTQTLGDIFELQLRLVDTLKSTLAQALTVYVAGLPRDLSHPFLRQIAGGWRFADSWSSRLQSGGFHTNHVHPHGWISSVYYVGVPNSVRDAPGRDGWLQFGQPDMDLGGASAIQLQVQPLPGRLVLFPSMFWHGTAPFSDAERRLTVAFDVVPA